MLYSWMIKNWKIKQSKHPSQAASCWYIPALSSSLLLNLRGEQALLFPPNGMAFPSWKDHIIPARSSLPSQVSQPARGGSLKPRITTCFVRVAHISYAKEHGENMQSPHRRTLSPTPPTPVCWWHEEETCPEHPQHPLNELNLGPSCYEVMVLPATPLHHILKSFILN